MPEPKMVEISPDYRCVSLNRVLYALSTLCPECQAKARHALVTSRDKPVENSLQNIISRVSAETGITVESIFSGRMRKFVDARRMVAVRARECGYTLPEIGKALHKDHTTILYLLRSAGSKK